MMALHLPVIIITTTTTTTAITTPTSTKAITLLVLVVAFPSRARILGECYTIHSLSSLFF